MNEIQEILEEIKREYCLPGQSPQINVSLSRGGSLIGVVFITQEIGMETKFTPITQSHTSLNHHLFTIYGLDNPREYFNDWKAYIE